ncbi:hypothetical protein O6H91_13G045500 [Diphasiastrum complanatum]|nr:hypothetical protein O6H91_13G045500 [Diphasiastrum complanatum]KAJ7533373.1 hypothetical protein O6H91_13G045500 [Diphasiastrum complanatum]
MLDLVHDHTEESKNNLMVFEACHPAAKNFKSSQDEEGKLTNCRLEDDLLWKFLNSRNGIVDPYQGHVRNGKTQHLILHEESMLSKNSSQNNVMQKWPKGKSMSDEDPSERSQTHIEKVQRNLSENFLERGYSNNGVQFIYDHENLLRKIEKCLADNQSLENHLDSFSGEINTDNGNLMMQILGEKQLALQALSLFHWMQSHDPCLLNTRSYSIIFKYLGQEGLSELALKLFEHMPQEESYHCVNVYNSLIGALLTCGRSHEVLMLLKQLDRKGVKPDHVMLSLLITAARKGKYGLKCAWNLFRLLTKTPDETSSIVAFGALIKAFCDEGLHKEGLLLAVELEKSGIPLNAVIYNTLIDAYGKSEELEEAEGLFSEMVTKGLHPNESTYNALINAYGRIGQYEIGEAMLKEMLAAKLNPNVITYTALMNAYGKQKLSLKAADVFLRMKNNGIAPNAYAYTVLIHAYSEGRWHEKAAMAFENMKKEGLTPTVETYTALLDGFRQAGDIERVKEIWKEMRECGCLGTRITFNVLVDSFAKQGLYGDARDIIHEFGKLGLKPDQMTYNMLINAYARGVRHNQAPSIIKEMQVAGFKPDSYTYSTLVYAFIRVRDFTKALKYHNEMCKTKQMPDSKSYKKMKAILEAKLARKLENDKKANLGQLWKCQGSSKPAKKSFWKNK